MFCGQLLFIAPFWKALPRKICQPCFLGHWPTVHTWPPSLLYLFCGLLDFEAVFIGASSKESRLALQTLQKN
jgi:hypothetical protein